MTTIGAQFLEQDFEECIASVRAAEESGYSHAWFIDSQILWQDCVVYMTHALAATEQIVVGTAVTNPVHAPRDGDRERLRDVGRASSRPARGSGSDGATPRCERWD